MSSRFRSALATVASAPWRRAPGLLRRRPGMVATVAGAAALLAAPVAAVPLFVSSAGTESVAVQRSERCPRDTGATYQHVATPELLADDAPDPLAPVDGLGPTTRWALIDSVELVGSDASDPTGVAVISRDGALDHVERVDGEPGAPGLWLSDRGAEAAGVGVGDTATIVGQRLPVAGIYRDLAGVSVDDYWCAHADRLLLEGALREDPPPVALVDRPTFARLSEGARAGGGRHRVGGPAGAGAHPGRGRRPGEPAGLPRGQRRRPRVVRGRAAACRAGRHPGAPRRWAGPGRGGRPHRPGQRGRRGHGRPTRPAGRRPVRHQHLPHQPAVRHPAGPGDPVLGPRRRVAGRRAGRAGRRGVRGGRRLAVGRPPAPRAAPPGRPRRVARGPGPQGGHGDGDPAGGGRRGRRRAGLRAGGVAGAVPRDRALRRGAGRGRRPGCPGRRPAHRGGGRHRPGRRRARAGGAHPALVGGPRPLGAGPGRPHRRVVPAPRRVGRAGQPGRRRQPGRRPRAAVPRAVPGHGRRRRGAAAVPGPAPAAARQPGVAGRRLPGRAPGGPLPGGGPRPGGRLGAGRRRAGVRGHARPLARRQPAGQGLDVRGQRRGAGHGARRGGARRRCATGRPRSTCTAGRSWRTTAARASASSPSTRRPSPGPPSGTRATPTRPSTSCSTGWRPRPATGGCRPCSWGPTASPTSSTPG